MNIMKIKENGKNLDLSLTVNELCKQYPELPAIMAELGFKDITKPMALQTVGRIMTIPKGAAIKGIDLAKIVARFESEGFTVISEKEASEAETASEVNASMTREELLQSYVRRLTKGEDLESVRKDFVENFSDVDASEIVNAEQTLIRSGVPIRDVQRMCDVHSALFHGATGEEALEKQGMDSATVALMNETGHPLNILHLENDAILSHIAVVDTLLAEKIPVVAWEAQLQELRLFSEHFGKKGDLLYPLLKTKYNIDAPYNVMWGVDDEIRDELGRLVSHADDTPEWAEALKKVLTREKEMVYKENNILFPLCAQNFSTEDWEWIRPEIDYYRPCLIKEYPVWAGHKAPELPVPAVAEGKIVLPSGNLTPEQINSILDTIPLEITFIDDTQTNRYFNRQEEKLFKRPIQALGRNTFDCHPPMVQPMVRGLLESFRSGEKNSFEVWGHKSGHEVLIRYFAVRNSRGEYLGALECVQNMDSVKEHYK